MPVDVTNTDLTDLESKEAKKIYDIPMLAAKHFLVLSPPGCILWLGIQSSRGFNLPAQHICSQIEPEFLDWKRGKVLTEDLGP